MRLFNVRLILAREVRDQLRDRRTLFMMFVLPLLLYPLLGMSYLQIYQFTQERATSVLILGRPQWGDLPPLVEGNQFCGRLFSDPGRARLLQLHSPAGEPSGSPQNGPDPLAEAQHAVQSGQYDAALYFPDAFAQEMNQYYRALKQWQQGVGQGRPAKLPKLPRPKIIYTTANERSHITFLRLSAVLDRWHEEVRQSIWAASGLPPSASRPPEVEAHDLADQTDYEGAALWSKILPVMLLIWALTGAFYPAVDLCAGEKERGTLETLLSAPAHRSEIVLGKLLTIMLFSGTTAVLNLLSVGVTGWLVLSRALGFGSPPPLAALWLALALVPVSALFSALCLALAAFARSSKEGQYYLMPLLLITMPLAVLPMTPGVELTLGNSLIPVTGVVLLLRSLLEGNYWEAVQMAPVVLAVTLAACVLAIRWAVDQFNSESVLFRESERLELGLWVRHLVRDRQPTPSVAAALLCGVIILVIKFFVTFAYPEVASLPAFIRSVLVTQLVVIAAPALLMTIILSSSPRETLLLKLPSSLTMSAAALAAPLLAVTLHPLLHAVRVGVTRLYPLSEKAGPCLEALDEIVAGIPLWQVFLLIALLPAVCEELAFRGFILSGFRHLGHRWRAILYTAFFFGLVHALVQQQLIAFLVGVVIGYVAVQTGSILPCMLFHLVHNSLTLVTGRITSETLARWPFLGKMLSVHEETGCVFHWPVVVAGGLAAVLLVGFLGRVSYRKSPEEQLQEAIDLGLKRNTR